jgi:hypothetical protein
VKKELKEIEEKLLNNINQNNKDLVSEEKNNLIKDIKLFTEKDCKDSNFKEKLFNFLNNSMRISFCYKYIKFNIITSI